MSRKMGVPFYAGSRHVLIYPGDYPSVLKYARQTGADYLVIDDWTIPWARPELQFLLDDSRSPPVELERIHAITYHSRKTILYHFNPDYLSRIWVKLMICPFIRFEN